MNMETLLRSSKHFVLVHGAGHGGWCWFKLRCLLEAAGHNVSCLDLSGSGIDPTDPNSILSFDHYDRPLFDFMSALPKNEKVILVGHSAGGLSLTHVMHEFADKIAVAIFVAATMLPSGYISQEDMKDGIPDLSAFGDVYDCKFSLGTNSPPTGITLLKEFQPIILYQMSPIESVDRLVIDVSSLVASQDSILASMLLRPWPALAIASAKFGGGEEKMQQVRRVFIKTTHDRMVKPEQQDAMIRRWPPSEVLVIDTDHSPFFSAPHQLFKLIVQASASG